jgi:hypothetical protein
VGSQGLRLSAVRIAIGLVAAFVLTRAISTLLVGVSRTDPLTFIEALLFLALAALAVVGPGVQGRPGPIEPAEKRVLPDLAPPRSSSWVCS